MGHSALFPVTFMHASTTWMCLAILAALIAVGLDMYYRHTSPPQHLQGTVPVVATVIAGIVCGCASIIAWDHTQNHMSSVIEQQTHVTSLHIASSEGIPTCAHTFRGSLTAATWTVDHRRRVGVLVGRRTGDMCRFELHAVGQ